MRGVDSGAGFRGGGGPRGREYRWGGLRRLWVGRQEGVGMKVEGWGERSMGRETGTCGRTRKWGVGVDGGECGLGVTRLDQGGVVLERVGWTTVEHTERRGHGVQVGLVQMRMKRDRAGVTELDRVGAREVSRCSTELEVDGECHGVGPRRGPGAASAATELGREVELE